MSQLTYIDLFAGAGGLSEGFKRAGFKPIAHVEIIEAAANTLKTRAAYHHLKENGLGSKYESYLKDYISKEELFSGVPTEILDSVINAPIGKDTNGIIFKKIDEILFGSKEVDLIVGGPPCQAYSVVGRSRSANNMKGDPRNFLYVQYAEYLDRYRPKMFVFENVLGLKSAGNGIYLENMEKLFQKKGYSIELFHVNARQFGVLQNRKRIILIGWRNDFIPNLPDLGNYCSGLKANVGSIFSDLKFLKAGEGKNKFFRYEGPSTDYLEKSHIRNGMDVVTQHVSRPNTAQDLTIYRIAVEKWKTNQERLKYTDLPSYLQSHKNLSSFGDRFKVVADD